MDWGFKFSSILGRFESLGEPFQALRRILGTGAAGRTRIINREILGLHGWDFEQEMNSLAQKVALVTGVTRRQGIGAAVALALARAGADVGTAYFRPHDRAMPWGVKDPEPEEIVAELRAAGVRAHGFEIDLAHPEGPHSLF